MGPLLAASLLLVAAPTRPAATAEAAIAAARARAARERKNVLVLFEASWCPWCRRFDALLADSDLRPAWERSYIVAKINVRERGERKRLENPGWERAMRTLRGSDEGDVPYMAITDPKGTKLADSLRPAQGPIPSNAGYPTRAPEIAALVAAVERTGRFRTDELERLRSRFTPATR